MIQEQPWDTLSWHGATNQKTFSWCTHIKEAAIYQGHTHREAFSAQCLWFPPQWVSSSFSEAKWLWCYPLASLSKVSLDRGDHWSADLFIYMTPHGHKCFRQSEKCASHVLSSVLMDHRQWYDLLETPCQRSVYSWPELPGSLHLSSTNFATFSNVFIAQEKG
jgi:hypothetical protein